MIKKNRKKVLVILGPTGSGKSDLALELAKKFGGYLISADSQQIYKYSNIGSNKDQGSWKNEEYLVQGIPEYLVDFLEPGQKYSAGQWVEDVKKIIKKNNDKLPIIVGGTGLYIDSLVKNYDLGGEPNEKLREKLEKEYHDKGLDFILKKIEKIDPLISEKIEIKNPRRVLRAAEIILSAKKPLSIGKGESEFDFLKIGIDLDRQELYKRLDNRAKKRIETGLIEETKKILDKIKDTKDPLLLGVGNRQSARFIKGEIDKNELIALNSRDNRRYAKRQLTWFRRDRSIHWLKDKKEAEKLISEFIE